LEVTVSNVRDYGRIAGKECRVRFAKSQLFVPDDISERRKINSDDPYINRSLRDWQITDPLPGRLTSKYFFPRHHATQMKAPRMVFHFYSLQVTLKFDIFSNFLTASACSDQGTKY